MPAGGKCVFNFDWLTNDCYKGWLESVKDDRHAAFCKLCSRKFSIASMGKSALKSHMDGSLHKKHSKTTSITVPIRTCISEMRQLVSSTNESSAATVSSSTTAATITRESIHASETVNETNMNSKTVDLHHLSSLAKKATDAEILWTLKSVYSHFSAHSNIGMNDLFQRMFTDSQIAQTYSLSESKFRYVTTFGLGPYLSKKLIYDVNKSPAHTVLFDEALNEQLQKKQFDVYVRYWSNESCQVKSAYLTSVFIGHGKTADLLNHYNEATKDLDPTKTWHIGMDGPNVNLAFERELRESREELDMPSLLSLGTCGLHIIHRAFQTGAKETNWNFDR